MKCHGCGHDDRDTRLGFCFDCATAGEERASKRTVLQHVVRGLRNAASGSENARFDFRWAWERLTRTGDYAPGGTFDRERYAWK